MSDASAGAGMIRYVGPSAATDLVRASVPEAVHGVGRVQAWLVGSGLEAIEDDAQGEEQRAQLDAARAALDSTEPCVVDAGRWKPVMADLVPNAPDMVCSGDFRTPGTDSSACSTPVARSPARGQPRAVVVIVTSTRAPSIRVS